MEIILAQGPGTSNLGNTQNSARQGPKQHNVALKLGLL